MNKDAILALLTDKKVIGVVAAAAGAAISHVVTVRLLEEKYIAIAEEEVEKAQEVFKRMYKVDEYSTPESAAASLGIEIPVPLTPPEILNEMVDPDPIRPVVTDVNAFESNTNEDPENTGLPNEEERILLAQEGKAYIIAEDEYAQNAVEYNQVTLTYYAEDDVLVDENSEVIPDVEEVVGEENLQKFGIGSGNNRIVYVRNERLEMDFQIVMSQRNFAADVHGFIEHSEPRSAMRRRRNSDE